MAGGLGGLGGFDIGGLLSALGQSLLTSPRNNWLQGLPAGMEAANKRREEQTQRAAMGLVAQKLGIPPEIAANPAAMALYVQQQNQQQNMDVTRQTVGAVDSMPLFGSSATPGGPVAPPAGTTGGLGGLGGKPPSMVPGGPTAAKQMPRDPTIERTAIETAKAGGLTNPYALAAFNAFGQAESGYSPNRVVGSWSDPSESGQPGTSGGLMSWRGDRFANMLASTGKVADPVKATELQTKFFLTENPELTQKLQNASSLEEAHRLLSEAWKYAGYNRPGTGEHAKRLAMAQAALPRFAGDGAAPVGQPGARPAGTVGAFAGLPGTDNTIAGGTERTTPEGRGAALTAASGGADQPFRVAAAGAKIPVPLQNVPDVPPPHPNTAGDGTTTQRALAQQQAKWGMKAMIVGGATKNAGVVEAGKAAMALATEYLKPTEIEKVMDAAGIVGEQRRAFLTASIDKRPEPVRVAEYAYPGQPGRQQQAVAAGMTDNRPEVVRLGEAAQDSPGLVRSGIETEAARKGADTTSTSRATATTAQAVAASNSALAAQKLMPAVAEARKYFEEAAKGGGVGPLVASKVARSADAISPEWLPGGGKKNEIARQNFESAIATVRAAKTAVDLKGQGAVSNFERTLAGADLPELTSADPSVAMNAFKRLEDSLNRALELDRQVGLRAGQGGTPPQQSSGGTNQTRSGVQWKVN